MFWWDGVVLGAWLWDLLRLSSPGANWKFQAHGRKEPVLESLAMWVWNSKTGGKIHSCAHRDETPANCVVSLPELELRVKARSFRRSAVCVMTAERGDTRLGDCPSLYSSRLRLAERWAVAETQQTIAYSQTSNRPGPKVYLIRRPPGGFEKRRRRQRGIGREFDICENIDRAMRVVTFS